MFIESIQSPPGSSESYLLPPSPTFAFSILHPSFRHQVCLRHRLTRHASTLLTLVLSYSLLSCRLLDTSPNALKQHNCPLVMYVDVQQFRILILVAYICLQVSFIFFKIIQSIHSRPDSRLDKRRSFACSFLVSPSQITRSVLTICSIFFAPSRYSFYPIIAFRF
jgi:hypothetical protein